MNRVKIQNAGIEIEILEIQTSLTVTAQFWKLKT